MTTLELAELIRSVSVLGTVFFIGVGIGVFIGSKLITIIIKACLKTKDHFTGI